MEKTVGASPKLLPMQKMHVRLAPDCTREQREDIINGMRTIIGTRQILIDVVSVIETLQFAVEMLNVFFTLVGALAIVLCALILYLSFKANVHENAWEFAVLRSVGLNAFETVLVYVYEAVALVLAAIVQGTAIGLIIAISLTLQFGMFTELPMRIDFPWTLFLMLVCMSLAVSVAGAALPAYALTRKTISNVLRRM
jgi:ABC-type antimicrobial peptide transport system permease subunit